MAGTVDVATRPGRQGQRTNMPCTVQAPRGPTSVAPTRVSVAPSLPRQGAALQLLMVTGASQRGSGMGSDGRAGDWARGGSGAWRCGAGATQVR